MTTTAEPIQAQAERHHPEAVFGLLCGIGAYGFWGFVAIYFKMIAHVAPLTVLAHRIAWSILFLAIVILIQRRGRELIACLRDRRTMLLLLASTIAIAVNWFAFIFAVAHGQLLSASLGYFINPLMNVMLGLIVLRERLRIAQTVALVLAVIAVLAFVIADGHVPILALTVAISFSFYGLLRKQAVVAPITGLLVETLLLLPFALVVIAQQVNANQTDSHTYFLLSLSGVITAVPLLWFAAAARRLKLSTLGFLQYLSPTGQFLLGRFKYHEPFNATKLACFSLVWTALAIFTLDSVRAYRQHRASLAIAPPE